LAYILVVFSLFQECIAIPETANPESILSGSPLLKVEAPSTVDSVLHRQTGLHVGLLWRRGVRHCSQLYL